MSTKTYDATFFISLTRLFAFGFVHTIAFLVLIGAFVWLSFKVGTPYALAAVWLPAGFCAWMLRNILLDRKDAITVNRGEFGFFCAHLTAGPIIFAYNEIRVAKKVTVGT